MKLSGNTILITGGATGIGLAMAASFLELGNQVLICGRRQDKLDAASKQHPKLRAYRCDISKSEDRAQLLESFQEDGCIPNVLINNAAVMRTYDLTDTKGLNLEKVRSDLDTNFLSPVELINQLLPLLQAQSNPTIINVSTPLGHVPVANVPFYCASKAALHSYTKSLRLQFQGQVEVIEIYPPSVDTEIMDNVSIHKVSVEEFNRELMTRLQKGGEEIWVGEGRHIRWLNRLFPKATYNLVNKSTKVSRSARP